MPSRAIAADTRAAGVESWCRFLLMYLPGRDVVVTVEELTRARTAKQRNALFGVAYKSLMEQMGLRGEREKEDLHEFMCGEFWGWREQVVMGQVRRFPARTTTRDLDGNRDVISTREQLALYAFIQQRAAEHGYDVPDPDPEWFRRAEREAELEAQAERAA